MQVVVIFIGTPVWSLDDRQAWNMRQRPRMPREVVEQLLLAEENRRVVRMGCATELDAKEAPVDLVADVLCCYMALGEEPEAEADPS